MPPAFVQGKDITDDTVGQNPTLAFTSNLTAGNLFVGFVTWKSSTVTLDSITDTLGHTITLVNNPTATNGGNYRSALFYAKNISGGADTLTFNFSASTTTNGLVHEVSGLDTIAPLDQSAIVDQTAPGTGTDAVTTGNVTTTTDGQYIFGCSQNDNGIDMSAGTGFTERVAQADELTSEDKIQTSADAVAATWTAVGTGGFWGHGIATFKAAAAAGAEGGGPRTFAAFVPGFP